MTTVALFTRAFDAMHAASLSLSAALQRAAAAINENTNRARLRALYGSYKRMAKGQQRRRRYYNPSTDPHPHDPTKPARPRKFSNRADGRNNERIREAEEARKAKLERRAARARGQE